jgi:hypothetical protein
MTYASAIVRRRQARSVARRDRRAVRLTERDLWLLDAVSRMRFLTTRQLARLLFDGSRWAAIKRLRALLDAGYLNAWVPSLSVDNVYSLTRRGRAALRTDDRADPTPGRALPRALDSHLNHLLAVNDARVALATGLPDIGGELVGWRSDWEIRTPGRGRLLPDALFAIRWDDGTERTFSLELDHHTKSPRRFLAKVLRYVARRPVPAGHSLSEDSIILAVGSDAASIERYRATLTHACIDAPVWFTALTSMRDAGIAEPIWRRAGDDLHYSLRALAFFPYRREDTDLLNAAPVRVSSSRAARLLKAENPSELRR